MTALIIVDTVDAAPLDRGTLRSAYDEYACAREALREIYAGSGSPTTNAIDAAMEDVATASAALRAQLTGFSLTEVLAAFDAYEGATGGAFNWERFNALIKPYL